jgi:hypothetical protein
MLSKTMTEARAYIHDTACAAVALLNSDARKVSLRFPNHVRPWLYQQLVADTSGRLAQLSESNPGVLTFAYALESLGRRTGCTRLATQLLRGIIAERSLKQLLAEAVSAWAGRAGKRVGRMCTPEVFHQNWQGLVESQGEDRQSLLRSQRLLIRRAGAGVPSLTLWLPPPPAFAPEDIPHQKLANARWFRVMKCLRPILAFRNNIPPEKALSLCMFVSRHALEIRKRKELGRSDFRRICTLLDYARANNHWPHRSTPPARYLETAEAWHHRFQEIRHLAQLANETGENLLGEDGNPLPFPEPPCPGWRSGEDTIVPLRTVEEVLAEGNRMHNCVASRVGEALSGRAFLYHGQVKGKPITIQIDSNSNRYRLVEAAGPTNKGLTTAQKQVVVEFTAHISAPLLSENERNVCRCPRKRANDHEKP